MWVTMPASTCRPSVGQSGEVAEHPTRQVSCVEHQVCLLGVGPKTLVVTHHEESYRAYMMKDGVDNPEVGNVSWTVIIEVSHCPSVLKMKIFLTQFRVTKVGGYSVGKLYLLLHQLKSAAALERVHLVDIAEAKALQHSLGAIVQSYPGQMTIGLTQTSEVVESIRKLVTMTTS